MFPRATIKKFRYNQMQDLNDLSSSSDASSNHTQTKMEFKKNKILENYLNSFANEGHSHHSPQMFQDDDAQRAGHNQTQFKLDKLVLQRKRQLLQVIYAIKSGL